MRFLRGLAQKAHVKRSARKSAISWLVTVSSSVAILATLQPSNGCICAYKQRGGIQMSQLGTFFAGDDTRLGVFYPQHSLLAIFPDIERAGRAKQQLRAAGFSDDEVLATSGSDLIELDEEESAKNGLHGYVMKELSR